MFFLLYKTTNLITGKFYIGIHKTKDKDDRYLGSGKLLKRAINKYGKENFKREIIGEYTSHKELIEAEKRLVNEIMIQNENNYNIKLGGHGGFDFINKNNLNNFHNISEIHIQLLNDEKRKIEYSKKMSISLKNSEKFKEAMKRLRKKSSAFKGKKHTEETKQKMKEMALKTQKGVGSNNSQFGTMWITNGEINKKIKKNDEIPEGFRKGRIIK